MDQTSTVEILDRCSVCVASKRSAQYCRVTLAHTAPRATVCASCLDNQATVTECRLKEGHRDPGVSTNIAVSDLQSYKLPQCCTQLTSLSLSKDKAGLSTYTGYMRGYTTKKWSEWLNSYALQTNFKFVANREVDNREGKAKSGMMMVDKKLQRYVSIENKK